MAENGLTLPADIIADGNFQRFPTKEGGSGNSGYYRLCLTPAYGMAGDWRTNQQFQFEAHIENETPAQRSAYEAAQEEQRQAYESLAESKRGAVKAQAKRLWTAGSADPDIVSSHEYIVQKGIADSAVKAGLKVFKAQLLVPMRDSDGELWNVQRVKGGKKRNLEGGLVSGLYFQAGDEAPYYLCEGPATGLSVVAAGKTAVCTFGAKNMPDVAQAFIKRGFPVVIAADNDESGIAVARSIQAATGCKIVFPPTPGTDFNDYHLSAGIDAVRAVLEGSGAVSEGPSPLLRPVEAPEPYPVTAFGQWEPLISRVAQVMNIDPAMVGQSFLSAASLAVQGLADIAIDGRRYPLSTFHITIAGSGERKSAVDKVMLDEHRNFERDLKGVSDLQKIEALLGRKAHTVAESGVLRNSRDAGAEGIKAALKALGEAPSDPPTQVLLIHDLTLEGLVKVLSNNRPSVAAITDEGGRILGGWALGKDHVTKTIAGLSSLWDGTPLVMVRAGDGIIQLYGRRLCLHWQVQPGVAQLLFSRPEFADQGFLWRCLISHPPLSRPAPYNPVNLSNDPLVLAYYRRIRELLNTPLPLTTNDAGIPSLELLPIVLQFDAPAKAEWIRCFDALESFAAESGPLFPVRGFARKGAEHIARLSGVFALMNDPTATTVPIDAVQSGMELVLGFYANEMLRLHQGNQVSVEMLTAQKLLEWVRDKEVIYARQVYQFGPASIRCRETALKAINTLVQHGWLVKVDGGTEVDNSFRKDAWRVVREG